MNDLLKDVMEDRAMRAGDPAPDLAAVMAAGDRRRRRTTTLRAGGGVLAVAATVTAIAVVGLPGDSGTTSPGLADDTGWDPRELSYASGSEFHVPASGATVDVGDGVRSYVATDDGFVWAASDGTVSFQSSAEGSSVAIGEVSPEGRYGLVNDDAGSLAAWIDGSDTDDPQLVVYDTARRTEVLRDGDDTGPGMSPMGDGPDPVTVFGIDGDAVVWLNQAGVVRTTISTGESEVLGRRGGLQVHDVGSGLIASDAGEDTGRILTRVGPSLTEGREIPHSGSARISPGADYVSFEDADALIVTDLATGRDVQPRNPGYDYWVVSQWIDARTFGGFGIPTVDESDDSPTVELDMLECDVPTGDCEVVEEIEVAVDAFALPVGESLD